MSELALKLRVAPPERMYRFDRAAVAVPAPDTVSDADVAVEREVMTPLAPGGALFFSSLLHYGTPPNRGAERRWALQYHYAAQSAEPMDKREHARLFFADGFYAGCRDGRVPLDDLTP